MSISLGPWPLGVDNVHAPSHRVFQVPGQGQPPARLRSATNVALDDEGWPSARIGASIIGDLIGNSLRLISVGGVLYVQAGASLLAIESPQ